MVTLLHRRGGSRAPMPLTTSGEACSLLFYVLPHSPSFVGLKRSWSQISKARIWQCKLIPGYKENITWRSAKMVMTVSSFTHNNGSKTQSFPFPFYLLFHKPSCRYLRGQQTPAVGTERNWRCPETHDSYTRGVGQQ